MDSSPRTQPDLPIGSALPQAFFDRAPEVVAPELLGAVVLSTVDGIVAGGRIVEVEAYLGRDDAGSHAATRGVTKRNAVMYGPPGCAYVYFTYGNHRMLNLVCQPQGVAGAVLIRALEPLVGLDAMSQRRLGRPLRELCSGPGKLAAALGIDLSDNGIALGEGRLTVYGGLQAQGEAIAVSGRIGLSAGHELDLRWYYATNPFVSAAKPGAIVRGTGPTKKEVSG